MRREKTIVQLRILAKLYSINNEYDMKKNHLLDLSYKMTKYQIKEHFRLSNYQQVESYMDKLVKADFVKEVQTPDDNSNQLVTEFYILEKGIKFYEETGRQFINKFVDIF